MNASNGARTHAPTPAGQQPDREFEDGLDEPNSRRHRIYMIAGLSIVGLLAIMWTLAFSGWRDPGTIDKLDDPAFARAAQGVCEAARNDLDALPGAPDATSPADRGAVIQVATDRLEAMVAELRTLVPVGTDDGAAITRWLEDWDLYLGDRRGHETELLAGNDVRFTVSATANGAQVTKSLDRFAEVANPMRSCATPGDLGG
ncbi:MAG: hypothetical protein GY929_00200 [Actinomycetia bacterium]|nr:hypothetical protein [Actinomycetes bacterium]